MPSNPQKTLRRRLFRLTRPIFAETLLLMSLGFVDVVMLSQISDACVAAVGLVNQILNMIFLIFIVGATGTLVVASQYLGAKRPGDFLVTVKASFLLNTLLGLLVSLGLFGFDQEILRLMDVSRDLWDDAANYLTIVGSFAFLHALNVTQASILRARELAKYPMYVSLITNVVNLVANYCLIFGHLGCPALGVVGAAWATVLSRALSFVLLLFFVLRQALALTQARSSQDLGKKLRQILQIGLPGAGEMFSYAASQVVITFFINMLGTEALAARTYLMNVVILTFIFAISMGQSAAILAGHLVGSHHFAAARLVGAFATRASLKISVLLALLLALAGPVFMPWLSSNEHIQSLCLGILWVDVVLEGGRAVNILTGRLLAAVGDPLFPLCVSILVVWSVATLGSYLAGIVMGFGLLGMWLVFTCDESLRAIIQWRYWQKGKWMHKSIC
ncbi:MAG: MATE family efflux transporter [Desulfovibrio sp.]|nr:MATE family efflux transporter [Desulfovibrio sp.]